VDYFSEKSGGGADLAGHLLRPVQLKRWQTFISMNILIWTYRNRMHFLAVALEAAKAVFRV
jgi:hypothetical protein